MATPPLCDFGWKAPEFSLPGLDDKTYKFDAIAGPKGTLIMFVCAHCPYVLAIEAKIARDAADLAALGIGVAAICSNDAVAYPQDAPPGLRAQAARAGWNFPYLVDGAQEVARAYDAVCTPDFFGFDAGGGLQYRGRLDASTARPGPADAPRDLFEAMKTVAETGKGPEIQTPSMGCSIKWKTA